MESENLTYPIRDFYEAAWLWLNNIRPIDVDRRRRDAVVFFFEDSPRLRNLLEQWSNWQTETNVRNYISALRDIKSLAWDVQTEIIGRRRTNGIAAT